MMMSKQTFETKMFGYSRKVESLITDPAVTPQQVLESLVLTRTQTAAEIAYAQGNQALGDRFVQLHERAAAFITGTVAELDAMQPLPATADVVQGFDCIA